MLANLINSPGFLLYFKLFIIFVFIVVVLCVGWVIYTRRAAIKTCENDNASDITIEEITDNPTNVYIDVSGNVVAPGIVLLDSAKRVGDAIKAAGGVKDSSSFNWVSKNLNLAQKLEDGMKIYVPYEWDLYKKDDIELTTLNCDSSVGVTLAPTVSATPSDSTDKQPTPKGSDSLPSKVNVNTALATELETLSGIGPAYAQRIIAGRPYKTDDDLISKAKIPASTVKKISGQITF